MNDNLRLLSFVFAPILLISYLIITSSQPKVTKEALNITSVEKVCHAGRQHFLVRYEVPDDEDGSWFIVAQPTGHNAHGHIFATECTGKEVEHPGRGKKD